MTFAVRLPSSRSAQPFFDSGRLELQRWRRHRIAATYDEVAPLLFTLATELTNDRAEAEELIVRAFAELGEETSILANGIASRRQWLLSRVAHHCHAANSRRARRSRFFFFAPRQTKVKEPSFGRALFSFLSRSSVN